MDYQSSKPPGWHSRRNQTSEAYEESYRARMDRESLMFETIEENKKARASRTSAQQLTLLDERLGVGIGAKKERKKLSELILKAKNK